MAETVKTEWKQKGGKRGKSKKGSVSIQGGIQNKGADGCDRLCTLARRPFALMQQKTNGWEEETKLWGRQREGGEPIWGANPPL